MLETFKKEDFLPGMIAVLRDGSAVGAGFVHHVEGYSDLLLFEGQSIDKRSGADPRLLDVMRVSLPSGAVLWERKEEPFFMTCIGCVRDKVKDNEPLCQICLRGKHESDVDFYQVLGEPERRSERPPVQIGDRVWILRNLRGGHKKPVSGLVRNIVPTYDGRMLIVVYGVGRGEWGKQVFGTRLEAATALSASAGKGAE